MYIELHYEEGRAIMVKRRFYIEAVPWFKRVETKIIFASTHGNQEKMRAVLKYKS